MIWTAANGHESCGYCHHSFAADKPLAVFGRGLKRCAPCVSATSPVDWDAVHAVIEQRRAQRTGEPYARIEDSGQTFERISSGEVAKGLNAVLRDFGIKGVRRSRQPEPPGPKPHSEVAHLDVNRIGGDE